MFTWQKDLVDTLGGYAKLEKYRKTFGDEFGAKNPFETGQVAMAIDGEWRGPAWSEDASVNFDYGIAPFPVPDDQADTYGKGYLTGTIIGIASTSKKQNAALGVGEVPDHRHRRGGELRQRDPQRALDVRALKSPELDRDPGVHDLPRHRAEPEHQHDPGQPQRRRVPADPPGLRLRTTSPARRPTCRPA